MTIFHKMAKDFYDLDIFKLREKLIATGKWPAERHVERIVPIPEAIKRLANPILKILVRARAVAIVESDNNRLIPVRVLDVMWGTDTTQLARDALTNLETEKMAKEIKEAKEKGELPEDWY